ncbi:MAG: hypothetical protein HY909_15740 [Deltaproteobacteria bacterium]|nr:hypothetical protein [Deltaproteobacteria bacterium]
MQCRSCGHVYEQVIGKVVGAIAVPLLALLLGKKALRGQGVQQAVAAGGVLVGGAIGHAIDCGLACPRCGAAS